MSFILTHLPSKLTVTILVSIILCVLTVTIVPFVPGWSGNFVQQFLVSHYRLLPSSSPSSTTFTTSTTARTPQFSHCLMYDKAPRTGSSTILSALRSCWNYHGYHIHTRHKENRNLTSFVEQAFTIKSSIFLQRNITHVAIAGSHFMISKKDVDMIQTRCARFFYITSTRGMRGRIASRAKYDMTHARIDINTTLTEDVMKKAERRALNAAERTERRLESYPFKSNVKAIIPHYVIRYTSLSQDLSRLLGAFGCKQTFHSKNIHSYIPKNSSTVHVNKTEDTNTSNVHSVNNDTNTDDRDDTAEQENDTERNGDNGDNDPDLEEDENDNDEVDMNDNWRVEEEKFFSNIPLNQGDERHIQMLKYATENNEQALLEVENFRTREEQKR